MLKHCGLLFAVLLCLSACTKKETGYHAKWFEMEDYSFLFYKGLEIDSMQFYNHVVMKKNADGACRFLVTSMASYSEDELAMHFRQGNTDAAMELLARSRGSRQILEPYSDEELSYIKDAAAKGNRYAVILQHMLDGEYDRIREHIDASPLAAYLVLLHDKDYQAPELAKLRKLNGYPYLMGEAAVIDHNQIDVKAFCEAYFQGCDLLEAKARNRIVCRSRN